MHSPTQLSVQQAVIGLQCTEKQGKKQHLGFRYNEARGIDRNLQREFHQFAEHSMAARARGGTPPKKQFGFQAF